MWLKAICLLGHLLLGAGAALLVALADALGRPLPRERLARWWCTDLLRILEIRVHVQGRPLRVPHLTVANHVSWLDIAVISAQQQGRFVARHDLQQWPLIGRLADACGTLYVHRGRAGTVGRQLAGQLHRSAVTLFPEGTTSDGSTVLKFHPRLLQAAIDTGCPVQAVALRYACSEAGADVAPFVGDDSMVRHIVRLLRAGELHVEISYGSALMPAPGIGREDLARHTQNWVASVLARGRFRPAAYGLSPVYGVRNWRRLRLAATHGASRAIRHRNPCT